MKKIILFLTAILSTTAYAGYPIIVKNGCAFNMIAQDCVLSGTSAVNSFNGRTGAVMPQISDYSSYFLQKSLNLSDLANVATARDNLGLGTAAVQDQEFFLQTANNLDDLQSVSTARTNLGLGSASLNNTSDFLQTANNLADILNASAARTNLGLGTASVHAASDFLQSANNLNDIVSPSAARSNLGLGTSATHASSDFLQTANNLGDVPSPSAARSNLGLGDSSTHPASDFLQTANNLGDVPAPSTARTNLGLGSSSTHPTTDFLQPSNNLSDVQNAATARTNLGLGTASTHDATDFLTPSDLSKIELYIDPVNGSDSAITGRGSLEKPYLTIAAAFSSVSAASTEAQWANQRVTFHLLPGEYTESSPTVYYIRRSTNFVGHGAKIINDFILNWNPSSQYASFGFSQSGLPAPWTGGQASQTWAIGCENNQNGMESGFTTGCMMILGKIQFNVPNYNTGAAGDTTNFGNAYIALNGVEARGGIIGVESGTSSFAGVVIEMMNSVISNNIVGFSRLATGTPSGFTLKASNSRIASSIGPYVNVQKLDSMRLNTFDRTAGITGTHGVDANGYVQFTNATTTSGITNCTFTGSTAYIGNASGTTNSVVKTDLFSYGGLRALTLDLGGGATWNIVDAPKYTRVVAANGGSTTIAATTDHLFLDPSATIAGYTVTMPAAPYDGQRILISEGGSGAITALTLNANTGQSFATSAAITTLLANTSAEYIYILATTKWNRIR